MKRFSVFIYDFMFGFFIGTVFMGILAFAVFSVIFG